MHTCYPRSASPESLQLPDGLTDGLVPVPVLPLALPARAQCRAVPKDILITKHRRGSEAPAGAAKAKVFRLVAGNTMNQ